MTRRSRRELPKEQIHEGARIVRVGPVGRGRWRKWGLALGAIPPLTELAGGGRRVRVGLSHHGLAGGRHLRMLGRRCVPGPTVRARCQGEFFRAGLAPLHLRPTSFGVRLLVRSPKRPSPRRRCLCRHLHAYRRRDAASGVPVDRTHYVPNGVDTTRFRPASHSERIALRSRLGLPSGRLAVYTGRLVSYKGLTLLLRVWCELCRSGMSGTLVMVGAGSADMHNCEDALRRYVDEHRLDDRVIFTGGVANVEDYLRAADVFVFPTEKEAFGVSLVEAMACGLPSVATRAGGIARFSGGWLERPRRRARELHAFAGCPHDVARGR